MKYSIGVDIGGMSIKVGLVDLSGKIIDQNKQDTAKDSNTCISNLANQIKNLLNKNKISIDEVKGIGIGCPGSVNNQTGVVNILPNLGWKDVPLVRMLKKYFNIRVELSNDASVATLAEAKHGCAKGYKNCIMFTLGTGVGGGMIIEGKIYDGGFGHGGELGHITLDYKGERCTCGRNGCIETFVSATALIKQTKVAMQNDKNSMMWLDVENDINNVTGKTAFECAKKGDKTAQGVVDKYVTYLGESILNMLNIFRPDVFIIGGGISHQGKYLTDKLTSYCEKFDYGYKYAPKTKILTAKLGNDAGIIGAASLID